MYFPFLRGKQFELIALREIADVMAKNKGKVSPIIEPVKLSPTLTSALGELRDNDINFTLIINPTVGDLVGKMREITALIQTELNQYKNFQVGINIFKGVKHEAIQKELSSMKKQDLKLTLIHSIELADVRALINAYSKIASIENNVINSSPEKTGRRYYREFDSQTRVRLEDNFAVQNKNSQYLAIEESRFSEEHLYFKEDGFKGFSDFLTIGDNYSDSGFLPFAVAIHISYVDTEMKIRIKHFVSDSNEDTADTAGKFSEALEKLVNWSKTIKDKTKALKLFDELYQSQHFPGLGTLKKLSIMHHIELVMTLI